MNVAIVMPRAMTNSGRMASGSTRPDETTMKAPSIGPTIPSNPAATVSQMVMPVARSGFVRQLPQMVAQLWPLME